MGIIKFLARYQFMERLRRVQLFRDVEVEKERKANIVINL